VKRRLLVILGLSLVAGAAAQETKPPVAPPDPPTREPKSTPSARAEWPGVKYAEVRAYLYNPPETHYTNRILLDGKLHPEVVNPEGIKLDVGQVKQLLQALSHREPDSTGSGCFFPHHGIVFYDRDGKAVADLSICILCTRAEGRPYDTSVSWDLAALAQLVKDLGLPAFKDTEEANAHFIGLARQWPDAKLKARLDQYLFPTVKLPRDDEARFQRLAEEELLLDILPGLGARTHPLLLACLADKELRSRWFETDPALLISGSPFHRLCRAFGDTPPTAVIPLLAPFLNEADASARRDAAETIAKTGAPEIVPLVRKTLADSGHDVSICTLGGLQVAIDKGTMHADTKAQLFSDVKAYDCRGYNEEWAKALIGLDSNKALEFFLSPEIFKADSPRHDSILTTLCEMNLQIPRERILGLVSELRSSKLDRDRRRLMEPALLLLGRQRNPGDLELLRGTGDEGLASCAMPGLLAWHGLQGYRKRLSKLVEEKGFDALSEAQRLHFAAMKFESMTLGIGYYFSGDDGDHWRDALAGLKAMKRDKLVAILEEAVAKFGEIGPANDQAARRLQLDSFGGMDAFEQLDQRRKKAENPWILSLDRFAIEHAESFK
jgi:hypothetical protein